MKKLFIVIVLAGAGWYGFTNYIMPKNQTWVHGEWGYKIDKVGEKRDFMVFHPNGTVDLLNSRKKKMLTCAYVTWGETLSMECEVKGEKMEFEYFVSEDKKKLENVDASKRSVYLKVEA